MDRIERDRAITAGRWGTNVRAFRKKISLVFHVEQLPEEEHVSDGARRQRARRSAILGCSTASMRNLRFTIDNCNATFTGMVTLTYPKEWPLTGRKCKEHLRAWFERLRRRGWMEENSLIWFLEFQSRGAPHFHCLVTGWISKKEVANDWAEITEGVEKSCSRVEQLRKPHAAAAYAAKYAAKMDQKATPPDFQWPGRFWGVVGKIRADTRAGLPLVPSLDAAIPKVSPDLCHRAAKLAKTQVRWYESPVGWTGYGSEEAIKEVFSCLTSAKSSAITDAIRDLSP